MAHDNVKKILIFKKRGGLVASYAKAMIFAINGRFDLLIECVVSLQGYVPSVKWHLKSETMNLQERRGCCHYGKWNCKMVQ